MTGSIGSISVWVAIGLSVVAYAAYALVLIAGSNSYSRGQKVSQAVLVVLVPLVGAVVVHWFASHGVAQLPRTDREFEPREVDGA